MVAAGADKISGRMLRHSFRDASRMRRKGPNSPVDQHAVRVEDAVRRCRRKLPPLRAVIVVVGAVAVVCWLGGRTAPVALAAAASAGGGGSRSRNGARAASLVSPVSNWENSWVASSVEGTVAAVSYRRLVGGDGGGEEEEEGVVILMRSSSKKRRRRPPSSSSREKGDSDRGDEDPGTMLLPNCREGDRAGGGGGGAVQSPSLRMRIRDPDGMSIVNSSRRWSLLPSTSPSSAVGGGTAVPPLFVAMTGLASDVDHVFKLIRHASDEHRTMYDDTLPHSALGALLQYNLRDVLYDQTLVEGGRPLAVQALVVGPAAAASSLTTSKTSSTPPTTPPPQRMALWTVDPGGGYRHWGVASAVGHRAFEVRKQLHALLAPTGTEQEAQRASPGEKEMQKCRNGSPPATAAEALELALKAMLRDRIKNQGTSSDAVLKKDTYEAVVMLIMGRRRKRVVVGTVLDDDLELIVQSAVNEERRLHSSRHSS